jgi:hypothetical protein
VFRASDLAWSRTWAPQASISLPSIAPPPTTTPPTPPPTRPRKRLAGAAVIQGELFALQPNVLPFQPQSRPGTSSKPM